MKKNIHVLIIIAFFSCQPMKEKKTTDDRLFLDIFTKGLSEESAYPVSSSNLLLFFKLKDNNIAKFNNVELFYLYKKRYFHKYINFNEFLFALYQEKLFLMQDDNNKGIKINKYAEILTIEEIEKKYCIRQCDYFLLKSNIDNDVRITLLYILFKNNMYIYFDDYTGYYIIRGKIQ